MTDQEAGGVSVNGDETHILLVDDDETWVRSTAQVLEHQRDAFVVETATGLRTASETFSTDEFDCVVCDYGLDAGTGLDLLEEVRATDDRPFILVTGQGSESVASDAIGQAVTDYIPKRSLGGRGDLLARRIETAVESYRTKRALERERQSKSAVMNILTAVTSRRGVAREVCEHLVGERGYECAWIGTPDSTDCVVPLAAVSADGYLDAVFDPETTPESGTEPALRALVDRTPQFVTAIDDEPAEEWAVAAAEHGFGRMAAVPISYEGATFGVLAVYGARPTFDAGEAGLLRAYGEPVGYALRSADWRESLVSPAPIAVEIELSDTAVPLVAVSRELPDGASLDVRTTIARADEMLYVVRVSGATIEEVRECGVAVDPIVEVSPLRAGEKRRCELVSALPTPEMILAEEGGRIVDETVDGGRATITVASSDREGTRSLIAAVRDVYPAGVRITRLSGAAQARPTPADPFAELTRRQRQAVEAAFYNGYFERPREHNTTEVAEKLGLSRQTYTQHLRAGERKLLSQLLESDRQ